MEWYAEMKLRGDGYGGGFSCGLTMCRSETMEGFSLCEETEEHAVYRNDSGVTLTVNRKRDGEATRVRTAVRNGSSERIGVEMLASFALRGVKADRIHRLQSFWSAEGKLRTETLEELHLEPSWNRCGMRVEKFGNVGSMPVRKYFPFLALEDSGSGRFLGIQLYCASSWQMEILCKEDETLAVTGGLADRDFGHWMKELAPGESFEAPEAVIAEGGSLCEVCHRLVKAQHPKVSPLDGQMDILYNEYCTTWGNPSYENLKRICDKLAGKGIRYLVIDSGWYGHGEYWLPLIAANLHRVIQPRQSQIWAVLRAGDSEERIYYSLTATLLGRMCLSGEIYDLSDRQWELVEEGMAFYRLAADIIRDGVTVLHQYTAKGYNEPKGEQLVLRELGNRGLAVYQRFEASSSEAPKLPEGCRILAEYGRADRDFSAKAWIYER